MGDAVTGNAPAANAYLAGNAPAPFLSKTYEMVDDPASDAIVSWGPGNNSFIVHSVQEFGRQLLPKYFKHNNFSSFVRQLNTYGFRKVDPDRWEFANEGFLRGKKHLLRTIVRRKSSNAPNQHREAKTQSLGACVEVGNHGMQEEGMQEEVERLKKDKNILMQELIVLRQRLQISDHELQTLVQRLKGMEQRQKQMMSFMSKAMQSPVFIKQFVNPNDNSDRRIITVNKKRRLPSQENKLETENTSPEGQIIKYQPLMTEAATSMLRQIMKLGTPQRMEPFGNENFFIDNFNSVGAADNGSNSSRNLGVTLSVVPTSPGISQLSVNSGFPEICSSVLAENQSPAGLDGMSMLSPDGINIPEFPHMSGIVFSNNQVGVSRDGPVPDMGGVYEGFGVSRNGPVPDMGGVYEGPGGVSRNGPAPDMGGVYEGPRVPRNGLVPDMGGVYEGPGVRRNGPVPDMGGVYEGSGVPDMGGVYEGPGVPRNGPVPDMGGLYGGPVPGVGDGLLGVGDGLLLVDSEGFALDSNIDLSVDDGEQLPSINDAFWEQFLTSPLPGDAEEAESGTELPEIDNDWQGLEAQGEQSQQPEMETQGEQLEMEDDWHNVQNMDSLTEQMGLLASERRM